jgi:ABC-type Fe3+-hydroxamate transport system substrate-binding protein
MAPGSSVSQPEGQHRMKRVPALVLALGFLLFPAPSPAQAPAQRIVSLIPSLTEDLFALGVGARVVAVSEYTDYPPAARRLPRVASISSIDAERIVALHPDLIVAIPSEAALVEPLLRAKLPVEILRDDTLDDIFTTIRRLGALVGRTGEAAALERRMRAETARIERAVDRTYSPRVFVVLDVAPIYTVGRHSYISTLIEMAGGRNAVQIDAAYPRYSAEALLELQPDVIVADPLVGFRAVIEREPWRSLQAVKLGHLGYIHDPGILLHPSPRYNEGLRWLIDLFGRVKATR